MFRILDTRMKEPDEIQVLCNLSMKSISMWTVAHILMTESKIN